MTAARLLHAVLRSAALRSAVLLCLCGTMAPALALAESSNAVLDTASVDAIAKEWLWSTGAPSVSIAIVQQGRLVYAKAYGSAKLSPSASATPASRYAIDSVSKEFTAAAALLLAQDGKLSLDDPLSKWFPTLHAAAAVTLRQLLTHTSGIRDYWPQDFVTREMTRPTTTAALIEEWARRPLDFEPGTDWQYSNTGYVLAGAIVEKAAGETLFEFLRSHVFTALRMWNVAEYSPVAEHSAGEHSAAAPSNDASGYTRFGLGPVIAAPKEGAGWLFGAANLSMSPSDLALWDVSLLDRSLLDADSYRAEFDPVKLKSGRVQDYALGLDVEYVQGRLRIGHSGSGSGFQADNRLWPKERAAIIVLTNSDWAPPAGLSDRLAFILLPPKPEEARVREIFRQMQSGSVDRALFTATGNFYLTAAALRDLRSSLGPLGPARWMELEQQTQRGGMITRRWKILCREARLEAIERSRPNGQIEEFIVAKRDD